MSSAPFTEYDVMLTAFVCIYNIVLLFLMWSVSSSRKRLYWIPNVQRVTLEELKEHYPSGSIVLVRHRHTLSTFLQHVATGSFASHVGILLNAPGSAHGLYIFESKLNQGAVITPLEKYLQQPDYDVWFRRIRGKCYEQQRKEMLHEYLLDRGRVEYSYAAHPPIIDRWIATLPAPVFPRAHKTMFCSEIVADCLQAMQVLPTSIPASSFLPRDFEPGDLVDTLCPMQWDIIAAAVSPCGARDPPCSQTQTAVAYV